MTSEEWLEKFAELKRGDVVCFRGVFFLTVHAIMKYGGAVFTNDVMNDGEIIPYGSPLWHDATVEGKELPFIDYERDGNDPADWWKNYLKES